MTPGIADHVLALSLFAIGLFATASRRTPTSGGAFWSSRDKVDYYLGAAASLWIVAAVVLAVWIFSGRGLAELGLRPVRWTPLASGAMILLLFGVAADTWVQLSPARRPRTRRRWLERTPFMPASGRELAFYSVLALTAGLCEELAFRGFLVTYLGALTGAAWLAIGIPAAVFAIGHRSQGPRGVLGAAAWAVTGGIVLVETGALWPIIIAHAGWDLLIGALGAGVMRDRSR